MNSTVTMIVRLLLAIILLVFGANKFFNFIPMEAPPEGSFMDALIKTGYMMPLIAVSEIIPGFLLLINKWKGLALVWLAPISINIVLFHIAFDISTIAPAALVFTLNTFLIYINWKKFRTLF
ncbi:DoxX family membrane protein [Lutibacter sp. TH_r2]|uniref:DoxX family membrane protein n=1 Tax=Lutibacter sp. TH_r2 TaxID=3082083 RepID=UPI0029542155|nr:DoxX family membrane protein [Lutibacter sp. TH_r2]MDV7186614.1 DoxX family membrane protein [Lutibacter sp. TH_r2]